MTNILRFTLCVLVITCFLILWELRYDFERLYHFIRKAVCRVCVLFSLRSHHRPPP